MFCPGESSNDSKIIENETLSALRLSQGLQYVIDTDSRNILDNVNVKHLHLLGEKI